MQIQNKQGSGKVFLSNQSQPFSSSTLLTFHICQPEKLAFMLATLYQSVNTTMYAEVFQVAPMPFKSGL